MELIQQLIGNLGVNEDQAKGGAGLLLKLAKDKLGDNDFTKVADAVPGVQELAASAPDTGGTGGLLKGLTSALGGNAGKLGSVAELGGGFSKLGLDSSMIGKFIPVVLSFVQSKGGDGIKDLLAKALG